MFHRPPRRARVQWRTWMPWYEFSRLVGEVQDHDEVLHGGFTAAAILVAGTLAGAFALPALALPLIVGGGLTTAGMLVCAHPDGARLVAELRAVGLPGPRALLRIGVRMGAEDARSLWDGRPALNAPDGGASRPLLLAGPGAGNTGDAASEMATREEGETDGDNSMGG
jgi:hypothetical protein